MLAATADHGGLSQRELGTALAIDPSAIVALVDDLERAGLARREVHPGDRRTRLVVPTAAGQEFLGRAHALAARVDGELLAPLTGTEQETLRALLLRITG